MSTPYGRNRESVAEIEHRLVEIFEQHENSTPSENGEPSIPADSLPSVLRAFEDEYGGESPLMDESEMASLHNLLDSNPGLVVTPSMLLMFIAAKTKHSPPPEEDDHSLSRNSSSDSLRTTALGSRPPSRGPPQTPKGPSPFDSSKRQRSTPLKDQNNPPSAYSKRPPPHRRKSDAGSRSDSESVSSSPTAFGRSGGRIRAPSNPTSPSQSFSTFSPPPSSRNGSFSPSYGSRPASRNQRTRNGYSSPEEGNSQSFTETISSLPMPRHHSSDSDDENSDEDATMGLVPDRNSRSSIISLEPTDKVDILQKANEELRRKLMDAERTLQQRMNEHESEIEDLDNRLEELKSELNATKREEKELRSKEKMNNSQIAELENEVAKLHRQLENSKQTYANLNKQYQEQCAASERYRSELRQREEFISTLRDAASLHEVESGRFAKEQEAFEERISRLEAELDAAAHASEQLDEQKQENLLLKETIDRMRFDLDELRNKDTAASSGQNSAVNTISKSLGAELVGKLKAGQWGMESEDEGDSGNKEEEETEEESDVTEGEGEDVVQTIITRKKRKVASKANRPETIETRTYEEVKEYSDSSTQYDVSQFHSTSSTQTDPPPKIITASSPVQTEPPPRTSTFAAQTEPEPVSPKAATSEIQIQTEAPAEEEDTGSSSSSTVLAPTPKPPLDVLTPVIPSDLPPAYSAQLEERERYALDTLRKWHDGAVIPPQPMNVTPEIAAEWRALKDELGFGCTVIDKVVEAAAASSSAGKGGKGKRSGKFYNIYNTYVYGSGDSNKSLLPNTHQALAWASASFILLLAIGPYISSPSYMMAQHQGATLYDRAAWQSFNSLQVAGEGFGASNEGGGTGVVWELLGRVGGGAVRIARGWPT